MGAKTRKLSQINDSLIEWQSVVVADGSTGLTAVAGRGYFINTTAGAITITTPASPKQGDKIVIVDYAGTFATNNVTINFNGAKVFGSTNTATLQTNYQVVDLIFIDNTQGWRTVNQDTTSDIQSALFIVATGGTVTTDGNYKIHTFTGDGCFVVSQIGNSSTTPLGGPSSVDYLVVAGGGGSGNSGGGGGGGGAGGYRESVPSPAAWTASPLANPGGALPVSATSYPITVGAGGTNPGNATSGSPSVFSTITSTGGGRGGREACKTGSPGGSGGGGSYTPSTGGTGNTPPVSPPQGNPGASGGGDSPGYGGNGGGGATTAGSGGSPSTGGAGGAGATSSITGSPLSRSGGGGGGSRGSPGTGGNGGGGNGGYPGSAVGENGSTNRGGGGGGGSDTIGGNGGSGIVVIRYKFQ